MRKSDRPRGLQLGGVRGRRHRFCRACRLNEVIPNLSDPKAKDEWLKLEQSKRRLLYTLLQLGLPVESRSERPEGLAFAFKQDLPGEEKVLIGHEHGLITINIAEADSPFREKTRLELGETYRTLLGHFRHEIGHYYWDRLIRIRASLLEAFRRLFGDERALVRGGGRRPTTATARPGTGPRATSAPTRRCTPGRTGPRAGPTTSTWSTRWRRRAASASRCGPTSARGRRWRSARGASTSTTSTISSRAWVPLTIALNGLNRSMGLPDLYPFVLSEPALEKMRFVHDVIEQLGAPAAGTASGVMLRRT